MPNYLIIMSEYESFSVFKIKYRFFFAIRAEYSVSFNRNNNYSKLDAVSNTAGYSDTTFLNVTVILVYLKKFLEHNFIFYLFNKFYWKYLRCDF